MSSFTKKLSITLERIKVEKKFRLPFTKKYKWVDQWRVNTPFGYHVGSEESTEIIYIKKDFITDGASIPRFLWSIIGHPFSEYAQAAVVHDFLYNSNACLINPMYSRKRCDEIFYEAMGILNVSNWKRSAMYQAVRRFGWIPWNKKKK